MTAAIANTVLYDQDGYDYKQSYYIGQSGFADLSIKLISADSNKHSVLLHQWMNLPHVKEYWQQAWSLKQINQYLKTQIDSYHEVYFVAINNTPVAYTELYPLASDRLSEVCNHHKSDWGWHFLIGPEALIGAGFSKALGHCILDYLFSVKQSESVFCEPDFRNVRMQKFVEGLAHKSRGKIKFSDKVAMIMRCDREDFMTLNQPRIYIKNNNTHLFNKLYQQ